MSKQKSVEVPILYSRVQQNVRLLELPEELLDIITSEPSTVLSFKSAPIHASPQTVTFSSKTSPHVALCTLNRTFQIRQVQVSNSVFLLQPATSIKHDSCFAAWGVRITANCTSTLESWPISPDAELISKSLQIYNSDLPLNNYKVDGKSKGSIFSDVPCSYNQFELIWNYLTAFEIDGIAYKPSDNTLVNLWNAIILNSTALGIDLETPFQKKELWNGLQDSGYPESLFTAVVNQLSVEYDKGYSKGLVRERCILWSGILLFKSRRLTPENQDVSSFLNMWKAILPDRWINDITMERFAILEAHLTQNLFQEDVFEDKIPQKNTISTKNSIGKRDWHEKFKKSRPQQ